MLHRGEAALKGSEFFTEGVTAMDHDVLQRNSQTTAVDAVVDRLNDPGVAAALVTLLDNAELLSTLVLGLSGMISRSETIIGAVADGVADLRGVSASADTGLPSLAEVRQLGGDLRQAAPTIRHLLDSPVATPQTIDSLAQLLDSPMLRPETVALLGTVSEAATEGAARARANDTRIHGVRGAMKALKDPDVERGLGVLVEIAGALGRRLGSR